MKPLVRYFLLDFLLYGINDEIRIELGKVYIYDIVYYLYKEKYYENKSFIACD